MISAIERGTKAATVLVLDRIATGLETSLARLLATEMESRIHVLRCGDQSVARDPLGWERRILSPVLPGIEFEFMRTTLNPGVNAGTFLPHARGSREYVAVELGTLDLTLDGTLYKLKAGDSIYYDGDCLHGFVNSQRAACVYYLAMDVSGDPDGTQHRIAHSSERGNTASRLLPYSEHDEAPGLGSRTPRTPRKAPKRSPNARSGGMRHAR